MRQIERAFETTLLLSRWLLAPFLLGLVCCLLILLYRFGLDLYELAHKVPARDGMNSWSMCSIWSM